MGKRKGPPPEEGAPGWMATYADLMSLLLCFFVMLFSMSIIAEVKWEALVETMEAKMGYSGKSKKASKGKRPGTYMSTTAEMDRRSSAQTGGLPIPGKGEAPSRQTITIEGDVVKGGLILFEPGNGELNGQIKQDLETLLPSLSDSPNKIMVKGHAAPAEGGNYSRDYYLAYDRVMNVMDYLISCGLDKDYFVFSVSDSSAMPNRAILPKGMTDPKRAGASVAVYLIRGEMRPIKALAKPAEINAIAP